MAYTAPPNGGPYVAAPGYPPHDPVNPQASAYPYPQQPYGAPPQHAQQYAPPPQHAQYPQYGAPAPSHPQPVGYQGPDAVAVAMPAAAHHEHEHKKSGGGGGGVPTAGAGGYSAFMEKRVRMGCVRYPRGASWLRCDGRAPCLLRYPCGRRTWPQCSFEPAPLPHAGVRGCSHELSPLTCLSCRSETGIVQFHSQSLRDSYVPAARDLRHHLCLRLPRGSQDLRADTPG